MNPNYQFAHVHQRIAAVAQKVKSGELKRVILRVPPRHGKSELLSVMLPSFILGHDPRKQVIATSYGQDLSEEFGARVRANIKNPLHQIVFPRCQIAVDRSDKMSFTEGGVYRAVGMDGSITGRGADLAIIDDPHKNRHEANSKTMRERVWNNFTSGIYTRLSPNGAILIVAARWHDDDLIGRCLRELKHENWLDINMPAINERGEALWPERWPVERLMEIKSTLGAYDWSALYQQRPTDLAGAIIKREWIKSYTILPEVKYYVWSWDTAIKANQRNDYSVGTLWAVCENGYYLVRMYRRRVEYPELKRAVGMEYDLNRSREIIIEDKASGQQLLQEFRAHTNWPVIAMMPGKDMPLDKDSRLHLVSPIFESGKVFVPSGQPWVNDVIDEWCNFPQAEHDDIVDSTTQFLARVQRAVSPRVRLA